MVLAPGCIFLSKVRTQQIFRFSERSDDMIEEKIFIEADRVKNPGEG